MNEDKDYNKGYNNKDLTTTLYVRITESVNNYKYPSRKQSFTVWSKMEEQNKQNEGLDCKKYYEDKRVASIILHSPSNTLKHIEAH
jgi:hypothetical protein